jgi:leucyl-tRNA synthetase
MGHARNYTLGDVCARFKRMNGFNVLYPMGYDSFGLPAENAAIQEKIHPKKFTENSIKNFIRQQKQLGLSYDWSRLLATHTPEYYKWNQWIFLQFFNKGLAYKKKAEVNWCKKCNTVLANEQVVSGKCWRHSDQDVELKELKQWFFKITDYSDRLLDDLEKINWPEEIKIMQRNWIGKSHGVNIFFTLENSKKILSTFTTRCDTIYSVTFLALAPESPLILELTKGTKYEKGAKEFVNKVTRESIIDRTNEEKEKEGFFIGKYAINPVNKEKIPIYIANFALMYGSGVVMCDAHDKRDFKFAQKYKIPLKFVISKDGEKVDANKSQEAYVNDGILFDSGQFSGIKNREALSKIANWLEKNKYGKKTINYKLRDWLISRQRYWGTPIPIIYCDKCGMLPVKEKDLPIKLPDKITFGGKGNPLETNKNFVNVKCYKCKGNAKRETDTMDTFIDSSWYFLRYCDNKNSKEIFNKNKVKHWMPIDQYIGGKEHATGHLMYSRFFTTVLKDLKLINFDEPVVKLFNQGMLHKEGVVMSKSKGNVVTQEEIAEKYGLDSGRLFLMFVSSPEKDMEWDEKGVESVSKFVNRFYDLHNKVSNVKVDEKILNKLHRTIRSVTEDIENFKYNNAIISLWSFVDYLNKLEKIPKLVFENLLLMMSLFCPHLCEELWSKLGNKKLISLEKWPNYNEAKISDKIEKEEMMIENTVKDIRTVLNLIKIKPKKVYLYVIPKEKNSFLEILKKLEEEFNLEFHIYALNDKDKYDPENKFKKAKPGKPAIFIE